MSNEPPTIITAARRSKEVEIAGRRYQVREPAPRRAFRVLAHVTTMLGPMLTKILSGQLVVYEPARCPVCTAEKQAETANGRWICRAETAPGQRCGHVWDKRPITRPDGSPETFGLSYVLGDRDLRAAMAFYVEDRLASLDPSAVLDLAEQALVGSSAFWIGAGWVELRTAESLDHHLPNGMAIVHLLRAAMEAWILPSLVDDWTDTTPASSTSKTTRGDGPQSTDSTRADPPAPEPSGTRSPPPVRRHG